MNVIPYMLTIFKFGVCDLILPMFMTSYISSSPSLVNSKVPVKILKRSVCRILMASPYT